MARTFTYITLQEFLDFDYFKLLEDRRSVQENCKGPIMSYRDFLGYAFFAELDRLANLGDPKDIRVLIYFDNQPTNTNQPL